MAYKFIPLIFPVFVLAKIEVHIVGKLKEDINQIEKSGLHLYFNGKDTAVISNTEKDTFSLTDNNLKQAVYLYAGKHPDNVYIRDPTPWGNLFEKYGWFQVDRNLNPQSGTILNITLEPVVILHKSFENNSPRPATFSINVSKKYQNTASVSWNKGGELTVGENISYSIEFKVVKGGGKVAYFFTSPWGNNTVQSQTITAGSTSAMELVLTTGQSTNIQLTATKGRIQYQMDYETSLEGDMAVNYATPVSGHHFWKHDFMTCMNKANLSIELTKKSREVVDFEFYTDFKFVVNDNRTGLKITEVPLAV